MFVTPRRDLMALAAAGSLLLIGATPTTALAADHHGKAKPAKVAHFAAHGTVVSASGSTAVVLARTVLVQHQAVRHDVSITVTLDPHALGHGRGHHAAPTAGLVAGNQVELQGTESGSGDSEVFTVRHAEQHAQVAHVFLGTVTAVNGTAITVAKGEQSCDDPGEDHNGRRGMTVDVSKATVTVDGAAGTLAVGQFVAVLGEGDHDAVLAAQVYAFTNAPTAMRGEIASVTGTQVMLGDDEDATTVDLAGIPLVMNGNPGGDVTTLTAGERAVILGSTDAQDTFTPALAFVFNHADQHPVGHNHDH